MGLNPSKGNMYEFITDTWNTKKGTCEHNCSYCYMKRFKQNPARFDYSELKTALGFGRFIFVGSSNDLFTLSTPDSWILGTLKHCSKSDNKYLFQSKNPDGFRIYKDYFPKHTVLCTTIETNRHYPNIMQYSPTPDVRAVKLSECISFDKYITIEPVMKFDLWELVSLIKMNNPKQVNIGADSGGNHLPEPSRNDLLDLTNCLKEFTSVNIKNNLRRLLA